jgi:hypothetical protein
MRKGQAGVKSSILCHTPYPYMSSSTAFLTSVKVGSSARDSTPCTWQRSLGDNKESTPAQATPKPIEEFKSSPVGG